MKAPAVLGTAGAFFVAAGGYAWNAGKSTSIIIRQPIPNSQAGKTVKVFVLDKSIHHACRESAAFTGLSSAMFC